MVEKIQLFSTKYPQKVGRGLVAELKIELKEVVHETPIKTGNLRSTEHVEGPEINKSRIKAGIVAGGPKAPYAVKVHEDLEAYHPVGRAKFIEYVLNQSRPYMAQRVANRCQISREDIGR